MSLLLLGSMRDQKQDPQALLDQFSLRLSDLLNPAHRMPLSLLFDLWNAAEKQTGDEALGIRVASMVDPAAAMSWPAPFSFFEHIGRSCTTTRDAIIRQSRYMRLMRDAHNVVLDNQQSRTVVRFEFPLPEEPRSLVHFHMASALLASRRILGQADAAPLEVCFKQSEPKDLELFTRFFNAPLQFGAESNMFVIDSALIDLPLPTSNPLMLRVVEHRAREALDLLPAIDDFVELVRERIEAELPDGNTNASRVAETLSISQRTLHRRLQTEGISYQDLLDKVRCRLAQRHLSSRKHSINEVAALVGFAQPSAFHRAFKSWTGETPAEYQERFASAKSVPPAAPSRR